eukprot:scaffold304822_cov17-Tisochrysis_lutea.AAC.1
MPQAGQAGQHEGKKLQEQHQLPRPLLVHRPRKHAPASQLTLTGIVRQAMQPNVPAEGSFCCEAVQGKRWHALRIWRLSPPAAPQEVDATDQSVTKVELMLLVCFAAVNVLGNNALDDVKVVQCKKGGIDANMALWVH